MTVFHVYLWLKKSYKQIIKPNFVINAVSKCYGAVIRTGKWSEQYTYKMQPCFLLWWRTERRWRTFARPPTVDHKSEFWHKGGQGENDYLAKMGPSKNVRHGYAWNTRFEGRMSVRICEPSQREITSMANAM